MDQIKMNSRHKELNIETFQYFKSIMTDGPESRLQTLS